MRCDCYLKPCPNSSKWNDFIKNNSWKPYHAENTVWVLQKVHFLIEPGVNGGLSCGIVCWRNEADSWPKLWGCRSGGVGECEGRAVLFSWSPAHWIVFLFHFLNCMHIIICIHQQLHLQKQSCGPKTMRNMHFIFPAWYLKWNTRTNAKINNAWYRGTTGYLTVTTFLTYIYSGHDQHICAEEKSIWILEWKKKKNSIKFYTISGAGIEISRGIRECISMPKVLILCAGKDNRDFSTIKQLILTMEFSSVISILTVTSLNSTTNELVSVAG